MSKMTVIQLLNKIANGEEIPKKIKVHYRVFEKYLNHNAYLNTEDEENYKYLTDLPRLFDDDRDWLNEEVEILEEQKKIPEKLDIYYELQSLLKDNNIDEHNLHKMLKKIELKQNEIIDYLESKGD